MTVRPNILETPGIDFDKIEGLEGFRFQALSGVFLKTVAVFPA